MAEETAAAPRQPATSWVSPESSVAPRNPGQLPLEASQEAIRSGEGGPQAAIQVEKKERGKEEEKTHDRRTRCKASIRPTTGKGEGLFATSAIGPSGLVLSQAPFAEFEMPLTSAGVEQALHAIDDEGRDLFWSFGGIGQEEGKDVDIAESSMIPFEGEMRGGMFETICRINHSCSPNARWVWRPQEGKMAVYALRSIKRGEEITASYLEEAELLAKNRELLIEDKYGFTYIVAAFERWDSMPIDEWFASAKSAAYNRTHTIDKMNHILDIIRAEQLTRLESRLFEYRFMLHAAWGEMSFARQVAARWEAAERIAERGGPAAPSHVVEIRRDPKKWAEWGKLSDNRQSFARKVKLRTTRPPIRIVQP